MVIEDPNFDPVEEFRWTMKQASNQPVCQFSNSYLHCFARFPREQAYVVLELWRRLGLIYPSEPFTVERHLFYVTDKGIKIQFVCSAIN